MSIGLTFGTISALSGLSHEFISRDQNAIPVTVVIMSAIVPTVIAERRLIQAVRRPKRP